MNKAIFLDKDGTVIPDIPYNVNPELITIQDNALPGLKKLYDDGYLLIVISNQSGVARGYFKEVDLEAVKLKLNDLLQSAGISITGFYFCFHHPEGTVDGYNIECDCRKPQPGMLLQAAIDHNIDLQASWMMGDILNDVEAGNRAGCRTILIDNGNETEWIKDGYRVPTYICKSINEAATFIDQQKYEALERL